MKIALIGEDAFFDIGKGYMIKIGSRAEVEATDVNGVADLVCKALMAHQFETMNTNGQRKH